MAGREIVGVVVMGFVMVLIGASRALAVDCGMFMRCPTPSKDEQIEDLQQRLRDAEWELQNTKGDLGTCEAKYRAEQFKRSSEDFEQQMRQGQEEHDRLMHR